MTPAEPGHAPGSVEPDVLYIIDSITVWTGGGVPSSHMDMV